MSAPKTPMVGWFDPQQLARTGVDVAISTIFGQASDFRVIEAFTAPQEPIDAHGEDGKPVWIDYTADAGDGWSSTYSVAYWMTRPTLAVATEDKTVAETTQSGSILVFGGDQVYPTPSRAAYKERLIQPYESTRASHPREAYAIPGNHDWYDNLVSFTRLFCSRERFAGWTLRQTRSYFAVRLRYGWWLIGTDMQLGSDIDEAQVKFFREAAAQMKLGDRVILCTAEPHWIFAEAYRETDPQYYSEKNLSFLESDIFADRIQIFLAGDLHHYRRHEADDGRQKITSGGGGAFLHPTHEKSFAVLEQDLLTGEATQHTTYRKKACYPDEKTSFRLCFRNLLFPFLNPKFGVVPALMYLLFAWSAYHELKEPGLHAAISSTVNHLLHSPFSTMLSLAIILAFIFFTDTHFRWYNWIGGGLHALLHLLTALLIGWGASLLVARWLPYDSTPFMLVTGLFVFAGGWIVGSFIFGIYLLLSMNLFRRHSEEAFSGLRIEDYKNFLRMRLDPDGSVTIFPIGIEKVAKRWKPGSDNGPAYEPDGPFTEPFLIEKPIHVGRVNAARGAL